MQKVDEEELEGEKGMGLRLGCINSRVEIVGMRRISFAMKTETTIETPIGCSLPLDRKMMFRGCLGWLRRKAIASYGDGGTTKSK